MVTASTLLEFFEEYRSNKAAEKLKQLVATTTTVLRDSKEVQIPIKEVVLGDVVILSAGSMIPADLRVLESKDLYVGQSALTGESDAVKKLENTEHKDFEEYFSWKKQLFYRADIGIFNADDERVLALSKENLPLVIKTFGIRENVDYKAENIEKDFTDGKMGMCFSVPVLSEESVRINTPGTFSVHNALLAMAVCDALEVPFRAMKDALNVAVVKGRMEPVFLDGRFSVFIDYAHNAMALQSLLKTVKEYATGRVICIFGCGGNRSRDRRFEMGEVSGKLADLTIITTDNPRFEEPKEIMKDIETGILKTDGEYVMVEERKEAIRYAIANAEEKDMIILAGKGHEDYQEIRGVKYHMDERELIEGVWKELNA